MSESHDPHRPTLTQLELLAAGAAGVLQNNKPVATLRLPNQTEVALPPGQYAVQLAPEDSGIELSVKDISIRLGGTTVLTERPAGALHPGQQRE